MKQKTESQMQFYFLFHVSVLPRKLRGAIQPPRHVPATRSSPEPLTPESGQWAAGHR